MIKKSSFILIFIMIFADIFADSVDIDVPDAAFSIHDGFAVPKIAGYSLDGTEEELILPFKKMVFGSEIVKVEILKQHKITLEAPLKKGGALYRLSDMHKVGKISSAERKLPSLSKFTFDRKPSFKRDRRLYSFDFYPIIPAGEKEIVKIDKIRVTTKEKAPLPMSSTKNRNSLLILTTEYFMSESTEIRKYVAAKIEAGFLVDIVTEKDYEGEELRGIDRAKKIREYLKKVYNNYGFLLIIAGTDPNGKEVPMIVTLPCVTDEPDKDEVPTDIFYAELTEDMDGNGNGVYGEYDDAIEYNFELIVGRIPIYNKNVEGADKILARTVEFMKERPSQAEYRRRILFPTTITYYKRQDFRPGTPKMDGAYIAEYLMKESIREPFSSKTLVEKEGLDPSEFTDEEALTRDSMLKNMNAGYGSVFWQAHGNKKSSARTIWENDNNGNGIAETSNYELDSITFVGTSLMDKVTAKSPFVFQGSCHNGEVQASGSLAYSTLKNTAVGVVGASQVSYGSIFSNYDLSSQDIFAYGAVFTDAVIKNLIPAEVLFETKEEWSDKRVLLTIKHETNYLGDPSLTLNIRTCSTDSDCDDSIFCNGSEICVEGICDKAESSYPCLNENPCTFDTCNESTKSCETFPIPDGTLCGTPENDCIEEKMCKNGECSDTIIKDCSHLDSECSSGSCDPETGKCVIVAENEGKSCSTGKFCVKNEVCSSGFCEGEAPDMPEATVCNKTECSEFNGFFEVADPSQNWNDCTTSDGKEGYCDYGSCTPRKVQKKEEKKESSSSGCSVTIF